MERLERWNELECARARHNLGTNWTGRGSSAASSVLLTSASSEPSFC